jgi:outer membrane lipoprotein-sorting protein
MGRTSGSDIAENMRLSPVCLRIIVLVLLVSFWRTAPAQQSDASSPPAKNAPVSLEEVVRNLQQRNAQRAAALQEFSGTRVYRMEYRGLPSDRDAQMVVNAVFNAPDSKKFTVLSESGSKFILDHVFKRLLEGEQEAANPQNRRLTALSTENYDFAWLGYESTPAGVQYVLSLLPKSKNKFLYRGKIWVDAQDFAVVRIEGEPAKNPSFWIKKTEIKHRYIKVNEFWLPAESHTESVIRLGGRATLTIEYRDYKITKSLSVPTAKSADASKYPPQSAAK